MNFVIEVSTELFIIIYDIETNYIRKAQEDNY